MDHAQNEKRTNEIELADTLELTTDDVNFITNASKEDSEVLMYDTKKKWEELNTPKFCQGREIQSLMAKNPQRRDKMITQALELMNDDDAVFAIIMCSLTNDPIIIHNCVQILALTDIYLLTFFFTTAASCNESLILKEIRE